LLGHGPHLESSKENETSGKIKAIGDIRETSGEESNGIKSVKKNRSNFFFLKKGEIRTPVTSTYNGETSTHIQCILNGSFGVLA